jgi:hypothetical protein
VLFGLSRITPWLPAVYEATVARNRLPSIRPASLCCAEYPRKLLYGVARLR